MKKFIFTAMVMCVCSMVVASCSDDDDPIEPLTADSVKGSYTGVLTISGDTVGDASVVVGYTVAINALPVDSILGIAVPAEHFDEALASAQVVDYVIDYTTNIFGLNLFADFTFAPVSIDVEYGGASHVVEATFYTEKSGVYNGSDYSFSFEMQLEKVTLDGAEVTIGNPQLYEFDLDKAIINLY